MKRILLSTLLTLGLSGQVHAQAADTETETEASAIAVFDTFLNAMTNTDTDTVTSLFAEDALFWGTGSTALQTTPEGVAAYFEPVGRNEPGVNIARARDYEVKVISEDLVLISGVWEVVQRGQDNGVPLRVSLAVARRGGEWQIIQFHNSAVPD